jgi:hypothetical protein
MRETLLQPFQPPAQSFSLFLTALLQGLANEGVRCCILRNYEGFPDRNLGNDVDFLISPSDLQRAIGVVRSIAGVRIIGYVERSSVALLYLEGISTAPQVRTLEVDFDLSLDWKGFPFLTTEAVLENAITRPVGNATFLAPSLVHEAIISLFASLLVGGWLKEKYFPKAQGTFASDRSGVIAALLPQFGLRTATQLVDSVIGGNRRKVMGCVEFLRVSLVLRSLLRRPIRSILAIVQHYASEIAVRLSPKTLETVCILSPEGGGRTTIIETLMPMLRSSAGAVENRRPWPRSLFAYESTGVTQNPESHAQNPRSFLVSMAKVVAWLLDEWLNQFFGKRNLTLRITESCWCDLLAAPERYRYGGSMWFVRLVGKLLPSPDLWIMLDPLADNLQSTNPEVQPAEIRRQLDVYRAFVKTRRRYVILDASQPTDRVAESAYAAIIDTLAQRADRRLKGRF